MPGSWVVARADEPSVLPPVAQGAESGVQLSGGCGVLAAGGRLGRVSVGGAHIRAHFALLVAEMAVDLGLARLRL